MPRDPLWGQVFDEIHINLAPPFDTRYGVYINLNSESTMPTWMTAKQISARFTVGEERLLEYSKRGNLAMYRMDDGTLLFDGDGASKYFRPRNATLSIDPHAKNLGVMGSSRLGEAYSSPDHATLGKRDERRRELRYGTTTGPVPQRYKKTG